MTIIMVTLHVRISHPRRSALACERTTNWILTAHTEPHTITHTHKDIPKTSRNYSSDFPSQHADWVKKIKITSFQLLLSDAVSISRIKVASKWPQNQQQCLQHSYILLRWTWLGNDSSRESTRRRDLYIFVLFCSAYDSQRLLLEEVWVFCNSRLRSRSSLCHLDLVAHCHIGNSANMSIDTVASMLWFSQLKSDSNSQSCCRWTRSIACHLLVTIKLIQ